MSDNDVPAGWYQDGDRLRWWDGTNWTEQFHDPTPASEPVADPTVAHGTIGPESSPPTATTGVWWRRWWVPVAALIATIALIAGILVATSSGNDTTAAAPAATTSTTQLATTTTRLPATQTIQPGGTATFPSGVRIIVPAGAASGPVTFTVSETRPPAAPIGDVVSFASDVFDIHVNSGTLRGPVTVTMPLTVPADAAVLALHHNGTGWEPVETTYDPGSTSATFHAEEFSPFGFVTVAVDVIENFVGELLATVSGGIFPNVQPPRCNATSSAEKWAFTAPATDMLAWCSHLEIAQALEVKVVNQKRYAVVVGWSEGAKLIRADGGDFASDLSELTVSGRQAVLAPGGEATIRLAADGDSLIVAAEYDGLAQAITALIVAAEVLAWVAGKMPWANKKTGQDVVRALDVAGCIRSVGLDPAAIGSPSVGKITELIGACLGEEVIKKLFGGIVAFLLGSAVATIASTISFFLSSGRAGWDLVTNQSRFRLEATRTAGGNTGGGSGGGNAGGGGAGGGSVWPTGRNDGTPAFFAYLGASLIIPSWTSCSTEFCLAASGDKVYVFGIAGGIRDHGWMAADTADPRATLVAAGMTEAQADAVLHR